MTELSAAPAQTSTPPRTLSAVTRLTLWFATAYTIVILVHEAAHAFVAAAQGLDTTMFHFWANIDQRNVSTVAHRAAFGVAGPLSSLVLGAAAWLVYRSARRSTTALPLLLVAACGVSNFFGNLMSAPFIGDFSNVAGWVGLPMAIRYAASVTGVITVACVLFITGRELRRWTPASWSRMAAAAWGVVIPVALGTVAVVVINQPVAIPGFVPARFGEAAFWVFAAAGTGVAAPRHRGDDALPRVLWQDVAIALMIVAVVRLLVPGIPLQR